MFLVTVVSLFMLSCTSTPSRQTEETHAAENQSAHVAATEPIADTPEKEAVQERTLETTKTAAPEPQTEQALETTAQEAIISPELAFMQQVQNYLAKNDIRGALNCFNDMPEAAAHNTDTDVLYASLLLSDGRIQDAQNIADELLKNNNDNIDVLELNAYIAFITNSKNRDSLLKQILAKEPYNAQANMLQAQVHFAKHRYKLANNSYQNVLKGNPNNVDALFGYGQTMFYMKETGIDELKEAENAFQKVLAIDSTHALALSYLGKIAAEDKNYLRATSYIQKAIAVDDANYDFFMDLGTYMRYQGKFSDAENAWTRAIALEPSYFLAYTYRASLYKEQKKYAQALADFNKAVETNPKYYYAYEDIGMLEWREQNWAKSRAAFQNALTFNKDNISYALMVGATYLKEKKSADCKKFLAQFMRTMNRATVQYDMARLYHDQGGINAENTIRLKLDKIEQSAERGKMWYYMGLYYELLGSTSAANEYYSKVMNMNASLFFEYELALWSINK